MSNKLFSQVNGAALDNVVHASLADGVAGIDSGVRTAVSAPSGTPATFGPYRPNEDEYIVWSPDAGQRTALGVVAHVHFEVQKEFIANLVSAGRFLTLSAGADKASIGSALVNIQLGGTALANRFSGLDSDRPQDYMVFDVHLTATTQDLWIDNVFQGQAASAMLDTDWVTFNLAASQSGTEPWNVSNGVDQAGLKNVYLFSSLQVNTDTVDLVMYGDSQVVQGGFNSAFYPTQAAKQLQAGDNNFVDQGASASIERILGNNLKEYELFDSQAASGATVTGTRSIIIGGDPTNDLVTQISLGPADLTDKDVYIGIGTNDISGAPTPGTWEAAFESDLITHIGTINGKGAKAIWMSTVATRVWADPVLADAEENVNSLNEIINRVAASIPNMRIWDTFTALGGHSAPQSYFKTTDDVPHYTLEGQRIVASTFATEFLTFGTAPTLTTPYSDLFNNTGDSGTVALGANVSGETAIFVDGLPVGATYNNNTGLITYNLTHNGQSRITVKPENSIGETLPNPMFTWYVGAQAEMFNNLEQIGSNGTMFTYKQDSLTLAEMNDAFFSNQYAASVLSTGDSLMIAGSDGTKMVNVTVVKQTRAVTLSTGLTIA